MTTIKVQLTADVNSLPLKTYLKQSHGISTTIWKRIKHSGSFTLNGQPAIAAQVSVKNGDVICYDIYRPSNIVAEALPLDIRYEDNYLLVINKPAGQLVHPTTKEPTGTVGNAVLWHYQKNNEQHAFHPVHRLDRETSGLVLIAKEPQVQYLLSPNGQKTFRREYLALIEGKLVSSAGTINAPIARALPSIILRKVDPSGKPACTHYQTVQTNNQLSLIQLELTTGRTHQIRVHLAHLGHPLLGDTLYGGNPNLISRQALHAFRLSFIHPLTKEKICLMAPLPPDMQKIVSIL